MKLSSSLPHLDLDGKRVLVRADLNVPTKDTTILSTYRLETIVPTLKLIQSKKGKIVLITHRGRPKKIDNQRSTSILIPWFENHGFSINFAKTIAEAKEKSLEKNNTIVLLENLRFFPGEKEQSEIFAKELASLGDYYVNDAFASLHNTDSSITLVPLLFKKENRTIIRTGKKRYSQSRRTKKRTRPLEYI